MNRMKGCNSPCPNKRLINKYDTGDSNSDKQKIQPIREQQKSKTYDAGD